jgi:hypothetical protein
MKATRAATSLLRTLTTKEGDLEIVVADATGKESKLSLNAETASTLFKVLEDFTSTRVAGASATLTKRPKDFAVGTGRFERVVLLRFEDEAPYALLPEDAIDLAEALAEQSDTVVSRPLQVFQ